MYARVASSQNTIILWNSETDLPFASIVSSLLQAQTVHLHAPHVCLQCFIYLPLIFRLRQFQSRLQ